MRGHVSDYETSDGQRWRYVIDLGTQPRLECGCGWRQWITEGVERTCPDCGGDLTEVDRRRQTTRRGFTRQRDADRAMREMIGDVEDGTFVAPSKATVAEYLRTWLDGIRVGPVTLSGYRRNLETYVIPRVGRYRLAQLTPEHLDKMYRELERSGRRDGGPLKPKTVRGVHVPLRKALQDAVDRGHLARNVADLANPPTARQARSRRARDKVWSAEQLRAFLDHCRGIADRLFALWFLIAHTGMRREDALGLRWPCVDLDAGRVVIRETLTVADNRPIFQEQAKSDAGERTLELDERTIAVMRDHRKAQLEERMAVGPAWSDEDEDDGLVFTQPNGRRLHPKRVSAAFTRRVDRAELPRIGVHGLRHTWATLGLRAGVPVAVVSQRLGHADPSVTYGIYAWVLEGDDRAAAETVADAIHGG